MRYRAMIVTACAAAMLVAAGCDFRQMDADGDRSMVRRQPPPDDTGRAEYLDRPAVRDETEPPADTAVETALEWARRYAEATGRIDRLQKENRDLMQRNQALQAELDASQADLARAKKELGEANAMLMDMGEELEKWKTDVLGFRDEMRDAERVQLDALAKILRLIGGQAPPEAQRTAARTTSAGGGDATQ